jgi:hypothetical protein
MVEGGDQAIGVAPNSVLFLSRMSSLRKKRGRGIYSPFQIRPLGVDYPYRRGVE